MKKNKILLLTIELVVGVTAVLGGYGLIFQNELGMSREALSGSIFDSYFWPGVILALIVGGTNLLAFWKTLKQDKYLAHYSAIAGFGLIIWEFVELYIIKQPHLLQLIYFTLGILILVLTMLILRYQNTRK